MTRILLILGLLGGSLPAAESPNILWFVVDDMSANFSCYGEKSIQTPHVDRLAREGTKFTNAFVTAPVCSACRSALITGMYQTSIGAHHHRSGRGTEKIYLPDDVELVPALLQKAGYYTCIGSGLPEGTNAGKKGNRGDRLGKTDYNFEWDAKVYNGPDWSGREPGQPFFMQVQDGRQQLYAQWRTRFALVTRAMVASFVSGARVETLALNRTFSDEGTPIALPLGGCACLAVLLAKDYDIVRPVSSASSRDKPTRIMRSRMPTYLHLIGGLRCHFVRNSLQIHGKEDVANQSDPGRPTDSIASDLNCWSSDSSSPLTMSAWQARSMGSCKRCKAG